jgi:hypothetical protein
MSKRKPTVMFSVLLSNRSNVYVLARHAKGALSVAISHGYTPDRSPGVRPRRVENLPDDRAINHKTVASEVA